MSLRTAIEKNEIIHYYQFHSIKQTVQKYNISRQTVYRYAKQGTFPEIQSNRKQKVKWKTCFTENEEKELLCSLLEFNMAGRKRNVITPSYSNLYGENGIYYGKRSYAAICKKARKLLELAHATKRKNNKKKTERKKYHGAKEPGTIQIDKLCIPESCYSGITTSIVALAEAKEELILKENKLFEETKEYCRAQMALNPGFQRMYSFLLQEWTKQHVENIEKINCTGPRDILEKRFYQYTAVDEYSRWTFRMIYL